jgi:hypothetical protein
MNLIRKVIAVCAGAVAALLSLGAAICIGPWSYGIDHTIQNAREIEKSFSAASVFVEGFKQTRSRLPTDAEFRIWTETQSERVHSVRHIDLITSSSQIPQEVIEKYGEPDRGAYVLQYWRGEWFEYFASWANASTLELDAGRFYFLGSAVADGAALLVVSVFAAIVAKMTWPRPI